VYASSYYLLEEARKTWEHAVSDKVVYVLQSGEIALDPLPGVAKSYIEGSNWIESHLTFESEGNTYHACLLIAVNEVHKFPRKIGEVEVRNSAISGNPSMLVNITEEVEPPEEMALQSCWIGSRPCR
jgi:hypothetical protein